MGEECRAPVPVLSPYAFPFGKVLQYPISRWAREASRKGMAAELGRDGRRKRGGVETWAGMDRGGLKPGRNEQRGSKEMGRRGTGVGQG